MANKIFSGDYSKDMWDSINSAESKADLRDALYFVCCRLQEFESRITKTTMDLGDCPYFHMPYDKGANFCPWCGRDLHPGH